MNIKQTEKEFVAQTYGRFDLTLVSGKGEYAYDEDGKEYIDMGSGIGVNTFGYCDEIWSKAVAQQISTLQHVSNLYYTQPMVKLAKLLCEKTGMSNVFFSNSGAEANECAIKAARKYSHDKYGDARHTIVTLKNSFHGRTLATLTATGQDAFHKNFAPFVDGFIYTPANDIDSIKKVLKRPDICAVMFECIQGEGGVLPLNKDFVNCIDKICGENDILTIADEVQTGNGRTGKMYAYEHFGICPDIVTTAKGIGGGLPLGVTLFGNKTKEVLCKGDHGSTFGGNPAACAGAITVVERLNDNLFSQVRKKGEYIVKELSAIDSVKSITGLGLMLGIECKKSAAEIANKCVESGLLVLTAKDKVRLLPPLNISDEALKKAVKILKEVIEE